MCCLVNSLSTRNPAVESQAIDRVVGNMVHWFHYTDPSTASDRTEEGGVRREVYHGRNDRGTGVSYNERKEGTGKGNTWTTVQLIFYVLLIIARSNVLCLVLTSLLFSRLVSGLWLLV